MDWAVSTAGLTDGAEEMESSILGQKYIARLQMAKLRDCLKLLMKKLSSAEMIWNYLE